MIGIDALLLAPFRGLCALAGEIEQEVRRERAGDVDRIVQDLRALHQAVECGSVSEQEFEERETLLLDRLELLQAEQSGPEERDS